MLGRMDQANWERIAGWAFEPTSPDQPVELELVDNGQVVTRFIAAGYREDLAKAGRGNGCCAFAILVPKGWSPLYRHEILVRRAGDGVEVNGCPIVLEPTRDATWVAERAVGRLARGALSGSSIAGTRDPDAVLHFLGTQLARLLDARTASGAKPWPEAERFRERWLAVASPPEGTPPPPGLDDFDGPLVLVVAGPDATGSVGLRARLDSLRRLGFGVGVATPDMRGAPALERDGFVVFQFPGYESIETLLRYHVRAFHAVLLYGATCVMCYGALARRHARIARIVYDTGGLYSRALAQRAGADERPEWDTLQAQAQMQEAVALAMADVTIARSRGEFIMLMLRMRGTDIRVVPWASRTDPSGLGFESRHDVALLVGEPGDAADDGLEWFIEHVWPLVRASRSLMLHVVSSTAPPGFLAGREGVLFARAETEADVNRALDRVRVAVVAARWGADAAASILRAMARGVPCVSTAMAAQPLDLPPDLMTNATPDAEAMRARIIALHDDAREHATCASDGLAVLRARFDPEFADELLADALRPAAPASVIQHASAEAAPA